MLSDIQFKVTKVDTGDSAVLTLDDLFGYEGETSGVLVRYDRKDIPEWLRGVPIIFNSNYGMSGANEDYWVTPI